MAGSSHTCWACAVRVRSAAFLIRETVPDSNGDDYKISAFSGNSKDSLLVADVQRTVHEGRSGANCASGLTPATENGKQR